MLLIMSSIASCFFKSINPLIQQENLPVECDGLISTVEKNWKQHKKLKYHKYNEEFLTVLQRDYQNCLMTFKKNDIIKLLGQPTEEISEGIYYDMNEGCTEVLRQNCKMLVFQFRKGNGLLIAISVQDDVSHIHNIKN